MSRRIDVKGSSLEDAVRNAISDLVDVDPKDVEVTLAAPGLVDVSEAATRLRVEIDAAPTTPAPEAAAPAVATDEQDDAPADESKDDAPVEAADAPEAAPRSPEDVVAELEEEADAAADFLEGLLDSMDLPGDLRISVHEDHAVVEMLGVGNGALIGRRGQTLESIQELVRCVLQRQFERRSRVKVDVEGYRSRRLEKLMEKAEDAIDEVLDSGEAVRLEPMDVFERKAVHHLVARYDGVSSHSQGREPARRVVIEQD